MAPALRVFSLALMRFFAVALYREFAGLGDGASRLPDETTILWFRHLLEAHDLAVDMLRMTVGA